MLEKIVWTWKFGELCDDTDYVDVTLVWDDEEINAHSANGSHTAYIEVKPLSEITSMHSGSVENHMNCKENMKTFIGEENSKNVEN